MFDALRRHLFRRRRPSRGGEAAELEAIATTEQKAFRYDALAAATGNFSDELIACRDASVHVFKGRLEDGRDVAVKRLPLRRGRRRGHGDGDAAAEFTKAARALSRVQHRNVATLYGYCVHGGHGFLVYERLPSLDEFVFRSPTDRAAQGVGALDWPCRYDVILGLARGLAYLHHGANAAVVHGSVSPRAVLLKDAGRVPKLVVDHRSSGLGPAAADDALLRVDAAAVDGHAAPEYAMYGQLSPKADVYSFGVVALEIITGRDCSLPVAVGEDGGGHNLLQWAWRMHRTGTILQTMDPVIKASTKDLEQVKLCAHVGLLCVQGDPKLRPDMKQVVVSLSKKHCTLGEPTRPGVPGARYRRRANLAVSEKRDC